MVGARKVEKVLNFKDWQIWNSLRGRITESRWRDRQSTKLEWEETVSGIYFFFSVFKQEKDLRFNKPWILSQRFIFQRNRYARRVGSRSTVQRRGKQLYEFSTKKTHPFIGPLSVSFGLETCMMGLLAVLHILFRPEREHKEKLERYTLHLQMITSVFSSSQHLTHVCENNICNLFSAHQNMSGNNV